MCLLVRGILTHRLHEGRITILIGTRLLSRPRMLQVEAVAPTPFPGVVQVEYGHHLPLSHLHQQVVKTRQDGVVIHPRCNLQRWLYLGGNAPFTVTAHQDAQVVDT